jgi:hypothetical protein
MFYNEYEIQQLAKFRREETERKARNAWKLADFQQESFYQKFISKWNAREKTKADQINGGCACQCG